MGKSSVGKIRRKWFNLRARLAQQDEIYYLLSENYRMLTALTKGQTQPHYEFDESWNRDDPIICHALGELDSTLLLECKESFEYHYRVGSRVFELDFSLTRDREPVVVHDWENFNKFLLDRPKGERSPLSKEEFERARPLGKYTPLTIERFVELARQHEDARFIISVKSVSQRYDNDVQAVFRELFRVTNAVDPTIKRRYILHAYSFEFLRHTMEEYPFTSAIYRCVQLLHPLSLAEELERYGIKCITVLSPVYARKEYCKVLHDHGIKVIGCVGRRNDLFIQMWRDSGADMLMTPYGEEIRDL